MHSLSGGGRRCHRCHSSLLLALVLAFLAGFHAPGAVLASASTATPPPLVDTLLKQAKESFSSRDYKTAAARYSEAVAALGATPDDRLLTQLLIQRGEVFYLDHRYEEAIRDFLRIPVDAYDRHSEVPSYMIRVYLHQGKVDAITDALFKFASKDARAKIGDIRRHLALARSLCKEDVAELSNDDRQRGLAEYAKVLAVARGADGIRLERARCAWKANDHTILREETNHVLHKQPNHLDALVLLGHVMARLGNTDAALANYRRVLKLDPDHKEAKASARLLRDMQKWEAEGDALWKEGHYADATKRFEDAYNADPNSHISGRLVSSICDGHVKSKKPTSALEWCLRAEEKNPDSIDPILYTGEAHLLLEDLEAARRAFSRAQEKAPSDGRVHEAMQRLERLRRMASRKDYYKILGIPRTATEKDVKRAYRKLAPKKHPDRFREPDEKAQAEKEFMDIVEASEVLSNEDLRRRYDAGEDVSQNGQQQQQQQQQHFQQGFHGFQHPFFHSGGGGGGGGGGGQQFFFRQGGGGPGGGGGGGGPHNFQFHF